MRFVFKNQPGCGDIQKANSIYYDPERKTYLRAKQPQPAY